MSIAGRIEHNNEIRDRCMVRLAFRDPILFQYCDYAHIIKPITNINKSKQFVLWYFSNSVSKQMKRINIFHGLETKKNTKKVERVFEYMVAYRTEHIDR